MSEQYPEATDDKVWDGTVIPTDDDLPAEEGDAGVTDDGTEEWYKEGDS